MIRPPDDIELRLRQLPTLQLPGDLKRRVMAAARLAPRASWMDRVWYSTAWRLAAIGTLLALMAIDHWSAGLNAGRTSGPVPPAMEEVNEVTAVGLEMGMPPEALRQLASRVEFVRLTAQEPPGQFDPALR